MIQWRFHIDDVEYEEPGSFTDLVLVLKRDEVYHGVYFEASAGSIVFYGPAANYIMARERAEGIKAVINFKAENRCDENAEYDLLITGKLNMSKWNRECGNNCSISVPIEQSNCTMLLRSRFDQKVDLDSLLAFDKVTTLENYVYAGFDMLMPAKALQVSAEGTVGDEGDETNLDILPDDAINARAFIRPIYENKLSESIQTTQLVPTVWAASSNPLGDTAISPQILLDEDIDCFSGNFSYSFRFKGHAELHGGPDFKIIIVKGVLPDDQSPFSSLTGMTILHELEIHNHPGDDSIYDDDFDHSFSGSTPLEIGEGIWAYMEVRQIFRIDQDSYIRFDKETSVNIQAVRQCPDTESKVYGIHESLSRITEAITNGCLRVKSDYYGRTDSRPFAAEEDGCGSLRVINSGLQLRNAVDAKMFLSLKDAFEGLNPIDNIGFSIESDPTRPGYELLRIEPAEFFYQDEEIIQLPYAPSVKIQPIENEHYANVKVGYEKWEVEAVNGLDEVNANREFRTSFNSVTNTLNILSKFVAGSYPIEITRQQSFAKTGGADTTYDNETFIYCVKRQAYGFEIEQGNVTGATDVFNPSSIYNWRIRPFYNLMRWFKTVAAGFATLGGTDDKLFFTSGTGNFRASGEQESDFCKMENGVKAENQDLWKNDFKDSDYIPIWKANQLSVVYPMSIGDYKKIKAKPYGYISVQCGTGEWLKGYVMSIQYKPTQGTGDFLLRRKWQ